MLTEPGFRNAVDEDFPSVRDELERQALVSSAADSLSDFVGLTSALLLEPWQIVLCEKLEALTTKTGQMLLIHGPPQFGKSLIISQRFPCWILGKRPYSRLRLACYNQTHATRFAKVNLSIMRSPEFTRVFPHDVARVPKVCAADAWSTDGRAALLDAQPSFVALGLGCGFTGLGADLLIVDDPYKNREEAYSPQVRERIWGWWTDVVLPRLNPKSNVVVMFHRWHEDDLAGRLIAQGGWQQLRFSAIGDGSSDDPMHRASGQPLSERYPVPYLRDIEARQGKASFLALYQGTPVPFGGNLFQDAWFAVRYTSTPKLTAVWTCWDTALKAGQDNDETACTTLGFAENGLFYVLRVCHGRWETPEVADFLVRQADYYRTVYKKTYRGDYIEDKVSGTTLMQFVRRSRPDLALIPLKVEGDKVARANGVTPLCEAGRILMPDSSAYPTARGWTDDLLTQLRSFPSGKHDDMCDSFVYAVKRGIDLLNRQSARRGRTGGQV